MGWNGFEPHHNLLGLLATYSPSIQTFFEAGYLPESKVMGQNELATHTKTHTHTLSEVGRAPAHQIKKVLVRWYTPELSVVRLMISLKQIQRQFLDTNETIRSPNLPVFPLSLFLGISQVCPIQHRTVIGADA